MESSGRAALPHLRGLDGLRGVAVLLVLLFHGGVPGFGGGFLGVSLFFTLSGYLITQLLLVEHDRTGRVSLRAFWGRRLRRLAPASFAALVLIAVAVVCTDAFPGAAVPGDVAAASLDVANWRFAVAESSYSDLFASGPSPVLHFWSLAIEEQFYVLFPLLVAAMLARGRRRWLPYLFAGLAVLCIGAAIAAPDDVAYYATFARAPELLAGALLALVLPIGRTARTLWGARSRAALGLSATALLGVLIVTSEPSSPWLFRGGLPAVSLLSVAMIAALAVPGPLRAVTEWRPFVALGLISYGVYVYHWPLFIVLDEERMGFDGPALLAVRLSTTLAVAALSAAVLEQPVRRGVRLRRPAWAGTTMAGALAAVAALSIVAAPAVPPPLVPELDGEFVALSREAPPVVDVLVVGSVSELPDLVSAAAPAGDELRVRSAVQPGCALQLPDRDVGACRSLRHAAADASSDPPDLVVLGIGPTDREELQDEMAAMRAATDEAEELDATLEGQRVGGELIIGAIDALPDVPLLLVDFGPEDVLARQIVGTDLRQELVTATRADGHFAKDLQTALSWSHADPLRVLVLGDSTSYGLATALDFAARDDMEVLWAGRPNCPLAPIDGIRWWKGVEFSGDVCPTPTRGWPDAVATLKPDVVLAMSSLPALSEHRYAPGDPWVTPGAPEFIQAHEQAMRDLQALLASYGTVTLIATVPPLIPGEAYSGPIADPARLAAWTKQIQRWDSEWTSVGIVDWGGIAVAAETAAGHHLRIDAVHFDQAEVEERIAPKFAEAVRASIEQTQTEMEQAGCLAVEPAPHLNLDRCLG